MSGSPRSPVPPEARLLVASGDDARHLRLRQRLRKRGFAVVVAGDGPSAIEAIRRERIDLVLLDADVLLPDAARLCRAIRALDGGATLPILLFADEERAEVIRRGFAAGATDIVWRPFRDAALPHRIRALVRGSEQLGQLSALLRSIPDFVFRFRRTAAGLRWEEHEAVRRIDSQGLLDWSEILARLDRATLDEIGGVLRYVLHTGKQRDLQFAWRGDDGRIELEMRVVAAGPTEGLAFVRDVTQRRRTEGLNARLARALDQSAHALLILDASTLSIEHANRSLIDAYGAAVDGLSVYELLPAEHHGALREAIEIVTAARGAEHAWSSVVRRRDGKRYPVDARLQAFEDEYGRILILNLLDATERVRQEARIRHLAYYDELTGLANRQFLREYLTRAIARAERERHAVALLFLDLDRFKRINDTLGHVVGDRLLQHVAEQLKSCLRGEDFVSRIGMDDAATVARLGGDEFMIVLTDLSSRADASRVADRVLRALATPVLLEGREVVVTPSIGIAMTPEAGATANLLIKNADVAMYEAKQRGRNRFCFFEDGMADQTMVRLDLEGALFRALANDELRVFYQPQVRIDNGEIVGMEALLRWEHPQHGLIPPAHFIPLAEETGQIVPLGEWVLRAAVAQAARWAANGTPVRVAVNVAVPQIACGGFAPLVQRVLTEAGLPAHLLELELTETALVSEGEVVDTLARLREHGVCIAVDDFGTGYSSLALLKRLPVDVVKIDRGFVADADVNADDAAIVESIVSMAHTLGRDLVAEGVERPAQAELLRRLRVQRAQGFLFYRPMPVEEATRCLAVSARGRSPREGSAAGKAASEPIARPAGKPTGKAAGKSPRKRAVHTPPRPSSAADRRLPP